VTPFVVVGDYISQKTWHFHAATVKQGGAWYFSEMNSAARGREVEATDCNEGLHWKWTFGTIALSSCKMLDIVRQL